MVVAHDEGLVRLTGYSVRRVVPELTGQDPKQGAVGVGGNGLAVLDEVQTVGLLIELLSRDQSGQARHGCQVARVHHVCLGHRVFLPAAEAGQALPLPIIPDVRVEHLLHQAPKSPGDGTSVSRQLCRLGLCKSVSGEGQLIAKSRLAELLQTV